MRPSLFGCLAAAALTLSAIDQKPSITAEPNDPEQPRPAVKDDQAMQILQRMGRYFEETNQFRVDVKMDMRMEARGMKQEVGYNYTVKLDRPQRFAVILNEGPFGVSVYCDGEKTTSYLPMQNQYTVSAAPETIGELGEADGMGSMYMGMMMGGGEAMGPFLSGKGVAEAVTKDVQRAEYLGQEEVNGVSCHHLKIAEGEADVDVWIAAGDRPLPHRIVPDLSQMYAELGDQLGEMNVNLEISFANWDVAPQFTDEDFSFMPPEGAEQVDSFFDFSELADEDEGPHPLIGEGAPAFETTTLSGDPLKLEDHLQTDVILLDFWAEWCPPCREGLPIVAKVAKEFADQGVTFYAVNLGDDEETIREFLEAVELELPVALDKEGKIGELYRASAIPQTVLIGKDGRVQVVHVGLLPDLQQKLTANIQDLLEGKDLATATLEEAAKAAAEREAQMPSLEPHGLELVWSVDGNWTGAAVDAAGSLVYAIGRGGELNAFDLSGQEKSAAKVEDHGAVLRGANLAGDAAAIELVSFDGWGRSVHAHDAAGSSLWTYSVGEGVDDVWPADLDGDGLDEVIIGYNGSTGLHVLDSQGKLLWKDTTIGNVWHVTAGDFNGDGAADVVTTSAQGQVHVFDANGKKLNDIPVSLYASMVRVLPARDGKGAVALVSGTGDEGEHLVAVTYEGDEKWVTKLPDVGVDHVDAAAIAPDAGLIALAMRGGLVHVLDVESGAIVAGVGRQGESTEVAWLKREGEPPLLVVATGGQLNAFQVTASGSPSP